MNRYNRAGLSSSIKSMPLKLIEQYAGAQKKNSIEYWQAVMFYRLAIIISILAVFLCLSGVRYAYTVGKFHAIIIYCITYITIVFVFFNKKMSVRFKTIILSVMLYTLGAIVYFFYGPAGDARFWLFSYVILCSLFIGIRASLLASFLNFCTDMAYGLLYNHGFVEWKNIRNYTLSNWLTVSSDILFISIIFSSAIALLIKEITESFGKLNQTNDELDAANSELTRAYESLRDNEQRIYTISNNIQSGMIFQLVVAKDGSRKFTYLSNAVKVLYGITPEEGMADHNLIYGRVHEEDAGKFAAVEKYAFTTVSTLKIELRMITPGGGIRWSSWAATPGILSDGSLCYDGIEFDITDRKNDEDKIQNLLTEKELLLNEVHHRIKNNMKAIKGLLSLQIYAEENPSALSSLKDAESRVQSMIHLYEKLNCSENYRELSVKEYLESLAEGILNNFPNRHIARIETEIEDFILNVQTLTPLGIIVNELLTNIMKHAFTGRDSGLITISASLKDNRMTMIVRDNGVGIPESVSFRESTGFGMQLVSMLAEQVSGDIAIERGNGTKIILTCNV